MIQKSELKQVPVEQRVPGRLYGVSTCLEGCLTRFGIFGIGSDDIDGYYWQYWFELPESMLPVREVQVMPEVGKEYEFSDDVVA